MLSYLIQLLFSLLPETRFFVFKSILLRLLGFKIGHNVRIVSSAIFRLKQLSIGDNTFIGHETLLAGGDALLNIGKNVDIGPRCVIVLGTHEIGTSFHRAGEGKSEPVTIGDGTWIGASSTILGGVSIGIGCVIAAGSLVRENTEDNSLVAGVPAKLIRKLSFDSNMSFQR
jgi:acetyltransferase-like isoleucine patch superfamily enzyme